ncbi:MAG: alginate lyase family protein [Kiritimatiellae bacterium]|nr:alginate lyase family protein [Kiritimatiellia bacterium]HOC17506.1 alginate lyase family protein [Vicinamibacterales bacterium]
MHATTRGGLAALISIAALTGVLAQQATPPGPPTNVRILSQQTGGTGGGSGPRTGIWIGKSELDALPMSGTAWNELKAEADSSWTVQSIETQSGQVFNVQAMAGALVYARLAPNASAGTYRAKVAQAIRNVMARPDQSSSCTAPNRNLGTWAISADLINLREYDPTLDTQFRAWLRRKLDVPYDSSPSTIRTQVARPNNQGAWACFAVTAVSRYLGDTATLNTIAVRMRRFLGDTSAPYSLRWDTSNQSWQANPGSQASWVGINPKGAKRDGHNFDGIQPEDQRRGTPESYSASSFPNDFSSVRYNEVALGAYLGTVLMLERAGYRDLVDASDQALLRAARWIKYAADNYASKGYVYFRGFHEAAQPLVNYFYNAGMPEVKSRDQMEGREFGYSWTFWTHAGKRLR